MTQTTSPALATALAYHHAWTSHDLDKAMTYMADDITCDAPGARIAGAQQYREFLGRFMTRQGNNEQGRPQMTKPSGGWFEITGKDGPALQRFYAKLFDWSINDAADGSGYGLVKAGEKGITGGIGASQDGARGGVTFYVEVDDLAALLDRAEKVGGRTVVPPTEIPDSGPTFAYFADPEGHVVELSKGAGQ